jgi:hypothetical protein
VVVDDEPVDIGDGVDSGAHIALFDVTSCAGAIVRSV